MKYVIGQKLLTISASLRNKRSCELKSEYKYEFIKDRIHSYSLEEN